MPVDDRMPYSGVSVPPHWANWKPARRRRWKAKQEQQGQTEAPKGVVGKSYQPYVFPKPPPAAPSYMPTMPSFEAGRRGLDDQYEAERKAYQNQLNLVQPQVDQLLARLSTDQKYSEASLDEDLAERGIYNSGSNNYLRQRDIHIPYGRERQDVSQQGAAQTSALQSALSALALQYNQQMAELLLNNAAEAYQEMPMDVPQFKKGFDWEPKGWNPTPPRRRRGRRGRNNA